MRDEGRPDGFPNSPKGTISIYIHTGEIWGGALGLDFLRGSERRGVRLFENARLHRGLESDDAGVAVLEQAEGVLVVVVDDAAACHSGKTWVRFGKEVEGVLTPRKTYFPCGFQNLRSCRLGF